MIGPQPYDRINTVASKEAERQLLASLLGQHLDKGGAIHRVAGFSPAPPPPRSNRIDPETVLKRRRPKPKAATSA